MPTTSRSSPTTTRAVNEKRLPPLTTLATRLISTTRSWRSRPAGLTERSAGIDIAEKEGSGPDSRPALYVQPGLAHRLGEGTHMAVVAVPAAVEDGLLDAGGLRALGEDDPRASSALGLLQRSQLGLVPVDGRQRVTGAVVDQLGREPAVGAKHGDPRSRGCARDLRPHAPPSPQAALALRL